MKGSGGDAYLPSFLETSTADPVRAGGFDRIDDEGVDLFPGVVVLDHEAIPDGSALVGAAGLLAEKRGAAELNGVAVVREGVQAGDDVLVTAHVNDGALVV